MRPRNEVENRLTLTLPELVTLILGTFAAGAWWSFPMAKRRAELRIERQLDELEEDLYL
jgi:hypothetical protein